MITRRGLQHVLLLRVARLIGCLDSGGDVGTLLASHAFEGRGWRFASSLS